MFLTTTSCGARASLTAMPAHLRLAATRSGAGYSPWPESPIRVVLADDHAVVRRCLRLLLDSEEDVEVIAEATDLSTVMRHVHGHLPHVLVLDLRLPNGSSIETIRRLRAEVPKTEIVVLTMEENPLFAQQAIDAGAVGYVLKDRADTELLTAIRRAARGEEYVSTRVAAGLDALRRAVDGDGLSPRETEVLRLIALGHTSTEIAAKLHLSKRTVETHRARIHRKLGLKTRAELVQFALRRHLIGA
jgi:two-component system response regulator NreC